MKEQQEVEEEEEEVKHCRFDLLKQGNGDVKL